MSRTKSIAVPLAALLAALVVAGCGGSAKDQTTSAASTPAPTTPSTTTTTTTPAKTTPAATTGTTGPSKDIADSETNTGGSALGQAATLHAANGGVLTITFRKLYDPVHSVSDFDPAPPGYRYVGVTLLANYKGGQEGVVSSTIFQGDDGSQLSSSLLADPDCGRNLVNLALLGVGIGKKGCIVGLAPKGVKPTSITVILRSGKDRSTKQSAKVPL